MRVLITGGSGFIGRYAVDALGEKGHEPILFDRHGTPDILGDIRDQTAVMEAVAECEAVMHLAGVLGTQETVDEPRPSIDTNISGGLNVFDAIQRYNVPAVNICAANNWMPNPYSITKKAAEMLALMKNREYRTKIALVRGLNVYGPGQKAYPVKKIMPNLILPALEGRPITIYGDGEQIMDMIYVEDMADILVRALEPVGYDYRSVIDAGTGRRTTVNECAEMVLREVGKEPVEGLNIIHVPMRPGEPEHSVVLGDPSTLRYVGLTADDLMPLEEGVKKTIASYW